MTKLGVEWVPLQVPFQRRLQTMAVIFYCSTFFILPILCIILSIVILFTRVYFLSLGYYAWIFYDTIIKKTQSHGGRRWEWYRRSALWRYFRDYFPMSLIKTADLDPQYNYIFGYHPHGVLSCGAVGNFGTEATGFSELFPGIKSHICTLKDNFKLPIVRGFILWLGGCDVSKESILYLTSKKGGGNGALLVVGGAEESLEARPDTYRLTLKKRKGFVKLALRSGARLVPVFSFGENDLYEQADNPKGSTLRAFQEKFKKLFGFAPPFFYGRGIFNYSFGMIPYRTPIHTIVGKPIEVEQCQEPKQEAIDKYHKIYMDELSKLFDEYKVKFGVDADKKLEFV